MEAASRPRELKRVLIIGGGFGGISAALALEKKRVPGLKIILISDKPHFEFTPALYRVVTGTAEACIPLNEMVKGKDVEVFTDSITGVDLIQKSVNGQSGTKYNFDFLILALGSETAYFNIPGLKELSFSCKSVSEATKLREHIDGLLKACLVSAEDKDEDVCRTNFVIVGGGANGVELGGELILYAKARAKSYDLDPSLVTVDLIEASSRLLPAMREDFSARVEKRLRTLGVNVFLNRTVVEEEIEKVHLRDMEMKTKTVIWTAGVKPHHLFSEIRGLKLGEKGRVVVDEYLQASENVFVIGDGAATPYTGMAQTAIYDGKFVADVIASKLSGRKPRKYYPKKPAYVVPIGSGWAAAIIGRFTFYGRIGWWIRLIADLLFFLSILPPLKAVKAFRGVALERS